MRNVISTLAVVLVMCGVVGAVDKREGVIAGSFYDVAQKMAEHDIEMLKIIIDLQKRINALEKLHEDASPIYAIKMSTSTGR
jgi:hypothetical protein